MATRIGRRALLKRASALVATTALGALAVACTPAASPSPTAKTAPASAGPIVLEEWNFSKTRIAWQQDALKVYQKTHPDIDVHWVILPYNEMHEKLLMTVLAGTGAPDIGDVEISAFSRFLKQKNPGFVSLNSRLQPLNALNNLYTPSATDPWTWNGQVYGLGNELNVCLWCYNWQVLKQYNVKVPIQTWDDFANEAKVLYSNSGGKVVLMDFNNLGWGDWWMQVLLAGGGFFDKDGRPALDSEASMKVLQYQYDAVYKDKWSITTPAGNSYNAALLDKSIASILGPSWQFSGFVQQALDQTKGWWMLQLMPKWTPNGVGAATWGGTGVCAMSVGKYPDQAADFVVWEHMTPEAVLFDYKERNTWPTLKTAWTAPELKQPIPFFNNQNVGELIQQAAPLMPKWYSSPYWAEVTDAMTRIGITPAMNNVTTPQSSLHNAQSNSVYLMTAEAS